MIKNYRRKDGSLVPVELIMDVFRDESGQALGLYAFITDIHDAAHGGRGAEAVGGGPGRVGTPRQGPL